MNPILTYRMIWRWHFYAGLLCLPFVMLLSITGPIYLFKPQIEAALEARFNRVTTAPSQSTQSIINAALREVQGGHLKSISVRENPNDALRIIVSRDGADYWVFVNPEKLQIMHTVANKDRFMEVVQTIHGELLAGQWGGYVVETASCWAIVMIISGLFLWWPRGQKSLGGVLWPRMTNGRLLWRDWHAVTGFWVSIFALFWLLTGLPWTEVWGDGFKAVRKATHTAVVSQEWRTSSRDKAPSPLSPDTPVDIEAMLKTARDAKMASPVWLNAPTEKAPYWTAQSQTQNRPLRETLILSPDGSLIDRQTFSDKHPIDQTIGVLIAAHEGQLFGWVNQLIGLITGLALVILCLSAGIMWFKYRPNDRLGAPEALPNQAIGLGLAASIIGLGLFLPLFGLSLILVIIVERLILRRLPKMRVWLGL